MPCLERFWLCLMLATIVSAPVSQFAGPYWGLAAAFGSLALAWVVGPYIMKRLV